MKSLLLTALAAMGVTHGGAFLEVWEVPYMKDHFTLNDLGRKLGKVSKWDDTRDALRNARDDAREETLSLYEEPRGPRAVIPIHRTATSSRSSASKSK